METTLLIPRILQQYAGGQAEVALQGETVATVLDDLRRRHPSLYMCICDETGALRPHLHLFVNSELVLSRNGLGRLLREGDMVSIFQAVSGG